jgi:hypothetical protein
VIEEETEEENKITVEDKGKEDQRRSRWRIVQGSECKRKTTKETKEKERG